MTVHPKTFDPEDAASPIGSWPSVARYNPNWHEDGAPPKPIGWSERDEAKAKARRSR